MKNFLSLVAVLAALAFGSMLLGSPANAGMILKQKNDGTAEWEKTGNGDSRNVYVTGRQIVVLKIENIASADSLWYVFHNSGVITAIYSTVFGTTNTADELINFMVDNVPGVVDVSRAPFATITIANGSTASTVDSSTGLSQPVDRGQTLRYGPNGASGANVDVQLTIVIDPY
jgi:hypothetical protein